MSAQQPYQEVTMSNAIATPSTWVDTYSITQAMRDEAAAYVNQETFECMRKVTVWVNPTTRVPARRYRAVAHTFDTMSGRCAYCGFSLED
jgi:excinuclease UvrABC ATPase subunit